MRISDWSSDVCSSDLFAVARGSHRLAEDGVMLRLSREQPVSAKPPAAHLHDVDRIALRRNAVMVIGLGAAAALDRFVEPASPWKLQRNRRLGTFVRVHQRQELSSEYDEDGDADRQVTDQIGMTSRRGREGREEWNS